MELGHHPISACFSQSLVP